MPRQAAAVELADRNRTSGDTGPVAAVVAVVGSRQEAELIVGMLKNHGIHASVSADDVGRVDLALQAQGVRVLVPDSEVSRARHLVGAEPAASSRLNRFQRLVVRLLGGPGDARDS
jgi:hypothetical protein